MKANFHSSILFFITIFCSFSSFAQDQTKCSLEFMSTASGDRIVVATAIAPELQVMLESKGYSPTLIQEENEDWNKVSKPEGISKINNSELASKLNGHIFLRFDGPNCNLKGGLTISLGSSVFGTKKKWECSQYLNTASLYAASGDQMFIGDFFYLGNHVKVFLSEAEGKTYIINELAKKLPTCNELRLKLPGIGLSKPTEINADKAALAPITVNDSSKAIIKEKQQLDESIGTSVNSVQK